MANGIQILPTLDKFAGVRGFANNLVAGLLQGQQQKAAEQQRQGQLADLTGLSQVLGQQGQGNILQNLAGFQPQTVQGGQQLLNLTSQLAGRAQQPVKGVFQAPGEALIDLGRKAATNSTNDRYNC
jgi:hypothetical protein